MTSILYVGTGLLSLSGVALLVWSTLTLTRVRREQSSGRNTTPRTEVPEPIPASSAPAGYVLVPVHELKSILETVSLSLARKDTKPETETNRIADADNEDPSVATSNIIELGIRMRQ